MCFSIPLALSVLGACTVLQMVKKESSWQPVLAISNIVPWITYPGPTRVKFSTWMFAQISKNKDNYRNCEARVAGNSSSNFRKCLTTTVYHHTPYTLQLLSAARRCSYLPLDSFYQFHVCCQVFENSLQLQEQLLQVVSKARQQRPGSKEVMENVLSCGSSAKQYRIKQNTNTKIFNKEDRHSGWELDNRKKKSCDRPIGDFLYGEDTVSMEWNKCIW